MYSAWQIMAIVFSFFKFKAVFDGCGHHNGIKITTQQEMNHSTSGFNDMFCIEMKLQYRSSP